MFNPNLEPAELRAAISPGRFESIVAVSAGGQGVVFRTEAGADHPVLARGAHSAFKVFSPGSQRERAVREVEALKRLSLPSMVRIVGDGVVTLRGQDCLFLETEFIEGETLQQRISRGRLSLAEVARVVHDVAAAIDAMWAFAIVHRDIKPANIMIRPDGRAVVIDLGVARHTDQTTLTGLNSTLGTLGYLSPEQARAIKSLSCKSDIFALGITAQEALLGRHPTNGDQSMLLNGLGGTRGIVPDAPKEFSDAIDSMLNRRPHSRPLPSAIVADMSAILTLEGYQ